MDRSGMYRHSTQFLCFLAVCGLAHGFQPQAPAKGSIEGQVVNAKTGTPLKRATVRLVMDRSGMAQAAMPAAPVPPVAPIAGSTAPDPVALRAMAENMRAMAMANRPIMMNKETDEQ